MTREEFNEKLILFEYEKYSEKEYKPISYSKFVTQKLIEARIELSKLHQPTVSGAVCDDGTCVYGTCTEADYMICINGCVNKQTDR